MTAAAAAHGYSRASLYLVSTPSGQPDGWSARRPGRRGLVKISPEVLAFLEQRRRERSGASGARSRGPSHLTKTYGFPAVGELGDRAVYGRGGVGIVLGSRVPMEAQAYSPGGPGLQPGAEKCVKFERTHLRDAWDSRLRPAAPRAVRVRWWPGCVVAAFLAYSAAPAEARDSADVGPAKRVAASSPWAPRARASSHPPTRVESYSDEHRHRFVIGTSIAGLDLQRVADVIVRIIHRDELSELRVKVVALSEMGEECGQGAVGCYRPDDDGDPPFSGEMTLAFDDPNLVETIVHEYGHHMDYQLTNLGHFDKRCSYDRDGSRRWFFARDLEDQIFSRGGRCVASTDMEYQRLLGELYAEDFKVLNGITTWGLSAFRSPTPPMLAALLKDIDSAFTPTRFSFGGRLPVRAGKFRHDYRRHKFKVTTPTIFRAMLRSSSRRDFDLYLYRSQGRDPIEKSERRGASERIDSLILPPGLYSIEVFSKTSRDRGRYSLRVLLD